VVSIVTLFCGVCKTNAAVATQILIDTYKCDIIINAGTAGGMDKNINLLDTIISTEVAHWDVHQGILTEFHPWADSIYWQADKELLSVAKNTVLHNNIENVYFGRMITGEIFIEDKYRDEINGIHSPLCVDMETASIAQTCYVNKVPFIAVRSITDTADHNGGDNFDLNCNKASQISAIIVRSIIKEINVLYTK